MEGSEERPLAGGILMWLLIHCLESHWSRGSPNCAADEAASPHATGSKAVLL